MPLARARNPATLVVTAMNGEPLPPAHGAPARLLVPGLYGIKHVKWLESIEVVDTTYRGYWQRRGWSDCAVIKTISRIDFPRRGAVPAARATRIAGMAYAGDRGISRVEVSEDDGADLAPGPAFAPPGPPLLGLLGGPLEPRAGGPVAPHRARRGRHGQVQTTEAAPALPDGASGLHSVTVGSAEASRDLVRIGTPAQLRDRVPALSAATLVAQRSIGLSCGPDAGRPWASPSSC